MKRRIIPLAVAACVLATTCVDRPAYALLGVGDTVFDPTNYAELITVAQSGINEVESLAKIYTTAQNQLQSLENIYNMFAHITNISQLAGALNTVGANVPMLNDAVQLENTFRGLGLQTNLAGRIQTILNQSQYYAPKANDFLAHQMNTNATAQAGVVAAAQNNYDAAVARAQALNTLKAQVGTNDPKVALDLAARGSLEAAQATSINTQTLAAMMAANANNKLAQQQIEQAQRASVDALAASAQEAANASAAGQVQLISGE